MFFCCFGSIIPKKYFMNKVLLFFYDFLRRILFGTRSELCFYTFSANFYIEKNSKKIPFILARVAKEKYVDKEAYVLTRRHMCLPRRHICPTLVYLKKSVGYQARAERGLFTN